MLRSASFLSEARRIDATLRAAAPSVEAAPSACPRGAARLGARWSVWASGLLIVAAVLAAYANSLHGPFVFDDIQSIVENPTIRDLGQWRDVVGPSSLHYYRPLLNLSLAISYAMGGLDVVPYHALNLAIHLAAALALFGIVRRGLLLPGTPDEWARRATPLALAGALVWSLHPLDTEAVTYIVQRCEALWSLLALLTLYCVLRAATSRRPAAWNVGAVLACALGMGAKENMAVTPLLVLLLDRACLATSWRDVWRQRQGLYLGLALTYAILVPVLLVGSARQAPVADAPLAPGAYGLSQLGVIAHYLRLSVWPDRLCFDYGWPPATAAGDIWPGALLLAGLLAATFYVGWRWPRWGFLAAAFWLTLLPSSSLIPIADLAVEHRMYLPLAPLVTLCVLGGWLGIKGSGVVYFAQTTTPDPFVPAAQIPAARGQSVLAGAVALCTVAAVTIALGYRTHLRNDDYCSRWMLWNDVAEQRPEHWRGFNNRGTEYAARNDYARAIADYDRSIELRPRFAKHYLNRSASYYHQGQYEPAIRDCLRAIELKPDFAEAYSNLGNLQLAQGRFDEARQAFDRALELRPASAPDLASRGQAERAGGAYEAAIDDFTRALALDPTSAANHLARSLCYFSLGRLEPAIDDCSRAIELEPDMAEAYSDRGNLFVTLGREQRAIQDQSRAIELKPDYAEAYYNRGLAYAQAGQFAEASADCTRALGVQSDNLPALLLRGTVYANQGRYRRAIDDYTAAIALDPRSVSAYSQRSAAHFYLHNYEQAWADVNACRQLGESLDPEFLNSLIAASGRSE